MMTIISMFRSMPEAYLSRYFAQVSGLPGGAHIIAVEGDSADDTRARLRRHLERSGRSFDLVIHEHGGPHYGQVTDPERFRQRTGCKNAGLDRVPASADVVVYVEGDLIWTAADFVSLAGKLEDGVDVIAPSVWAGYSFYDIWGFRDLDGRWFESGPPYSPSLNDDELTEVGSAGSCLVMRAQVAHMCRMTDEEEIVGFCKDARSKGFRIFTDWNTRIYHPC